MTDLLQLNETLGINSAGLLVALFVEPLLQVIGFIAIVIIAFNHYQKTRNRGALLIVAALVSSAVCSIAIEYVASFFDGAAYELVEVLLRLVDGLLLIAFILGFYSICRQQSSSPLMPVSNANRKSGNV